MSFKCGNNKPGGTGRREVCRQAFMLTLPVMAGYLVLGTGFGILMYTNGYSVIWVFAMSLLIYAGSMQYVTIDLLTGGASLISSALMTLMVNARHLFYGISMHERYRGMGKYKPYLIFGLTDETYSLVCSVDAPDGASPGFFYFLITLFNQLYWITGSVFGCIAGHFLKFNTAGIEFSMTALFVVVFTGQWIENKDHFSALAGLFCSLFCLLVFGPDRFLIPTMFMITVVLLLRGHQKGEYR